MCAMLPRLVGGAEPWSPVLSRLADPQDQSPSPVPPPVPLESGGGGGVSGRGGCFCDATGNEYVESDCRIR